MKIAKMAFTRFCDRQVQYMSSYPKSGGGGGGGEGGGHNLLPIKSRLSAMNTCSTCRCKKQVRFSS